MDEPRRELPEPTPHWPGGPTAHDDPTPIESALAALKIGAILAARPDLVLLDLRLEDGSGFDVLRAVHGTEPGIDFYMLSNFATEPYRRHAERLGACGFFDKTTDFDRLRELVAQRVAA